MKQFIPSLITLTNLACGCMVVVYVLKPFSFFDSTATWTILILMVIAMVCDFADGLVARLLGVSSEIGKQLDSLADLVTFGLVPGVMVYAMLSAYTIKFMTSDSWWLITFLPFLGLIIPLFSAYRLAKFNVDTRQTDHFRGLATPPNALFFLSLYLIFCEMAQSDVGDNKMSAGETPFEGPFPGFLSFLVNPYVLSILTIFFSILLVTDLPLLAFKVKDYSFGKNVNRYLFLGISLILLIILWYKAIPFIIVLYFIFSFIERVQKTP